MFKKRMHPMPTRIIKTTNTCGNHGTCSDFAWVVATLALVFLLGGCQWFRFEERRENARIEKALQQAAPKELEGAQTRSERPVPLTGKGSVAQIAWLDFHEEAPTVRIKAAEGGGAAIQGAPLKLPPGSALAEVVADPQGRLHVFYQMRHGETQWLYHAIRDQGEWRKPEKLTEGNLSALSANALVDAQGVVHLVIQLVEQHFGMLEYMRWEGGAWTSVAKLRPEGGKETFWQPRLGQGAGGRVFLAYTRMHMKGGDIQVRMTDAKGGLGEPENPPMPGAHNAWPQPQLFSDGSERLLWLGGPNSGSVYSATREKDGKWSKAAMIFSRERNIYGLRIAVAPDNRIYLVWAEVENGMQPAIYAVSGRNGEWTKAVRINQDKAPAKMPALSLREGRLDLYWVEILSRDSYGIKTATVALK